MSPKAVTQGEDLKDSLAVLGRKLVVGFRAAV